ncbi:ABC transporter ATP-binding protein [Mangrovicoccus ximenensis]|uniref:ABC transporter ATP-binding protein n=1 Tax=Mangrovicoccus ximenensis TaxID=1911570 RepID=UPI000D3A5C9C|nr:ABC transporter ATP-binding protein [Mangrovicoccus ximenensis]
MAAAGDIIRTAGLGKTYRSGALEVQALRSVDFAASPGEFTVILGPSGSGKSTFLNILGGLDTATSGQVWFRGQELTRLSERGLTRYRRDYVGFVFQFYNLVPSLTALENVALVTEIARDPMRPEEALDLVGLAARRDHFPAQLSGGEQQRVAIARAIAKRPDLLFCDEPTGALDSATGIRVLEALTEVNSATGATTRRVPGTPCPPAFLGPGRGRGGTASASHGPADPAEGQENVNVFQQVA